MGKKVWMSKVLTCPACNREVPRSEVRPFGFSCPHCREPLEIDTRYALPAELVSLILAASLSYAAGKSGYKFLLSTLIWSVFIFLVAALLNRRFWLKLKSRKPVYGVDFRITGPPDSSRRS